MGLDMYLTARHFLGFDKEKPEMDFIPKGYEPETVLVQAAYWRKANAIHQWFVNEVQDGEDDCRPYYVTDTQLVELQDTCQQVIDAPSVAEELLPCQSGFFFGGTDYDEGYFEDLRNTISQLDKILKSFPSPHWSFEYQSSW